jgi:hypothetical protein
LKDAAVGAKGCAELVIAVGDNKGVCANSGMDPKESTRNPGILDRERDNFMMEGRIGRSDRQISTPVW